MCDRQRYHCATRARIRVPSPESNIELGSDTAAATHSDEDVPMLDPEENLVSVYNYPTYLDLG